MAGIHITKFNGVRPILDARQLTAEEAQVAHNCLLVDGSLRPLPAWLTLQTGATSIAPPHAGSLYTVMPGYSGVDLLGKPFGKQKVYLDDSGNLQPFLGPGLTPAGNVSVVAAGLSKKAVNRVYGVTTVFNFGGVDFESALGICTGSDPAGLMYEGDTAAVNMGGAGYKMRLYRSTSDVTAGAGANGAVTANWQLVAEIPGRAASYVDAGAAVANPMDTYLFRGHLGQPFLASRFGLLECGVFWMVSPSAEVALSDRYSWAHWPVENMYSLGDDGQGALVATGAVCVGDVLYLGTTTQVFVGSVKITDTGTPVMALVPIPHAPPCINGSMVATPKGAIYTSTVGVIGVTGNTAVNLTRSVARDSVGFLPDGQEMLFSEITQAYYHNGKYYAFSNNVPAGGGV